MKQTICDALREREKKTLKKADNKTYFRNQRKNK